MARVLDDSTDRLITSLLISDGRRTLKSVAEATGLSVSAVQARVRRLETDGVIRGYSASVDPEAVGLPLAALIAINPLDPNHEYEIPQRLEGLLEIESCHSVAGEASFMLFARVGVADRPGDPDPRDSPPGQRLYPDDGCPTDVLRASGDADRDRNGIVPVSCRRDRKFSCLTAIVWS